MKRVMYAVSAVSLALMFLFFGLAAGTRAGIFLTLGITALTVCYHFTVRLVVGNILDLFQFDCRSKWFAQLPFEEKLYKGLGVRRWKEYLPTYDEKRYSMSSNSLLDIASATCRSEVVHEINVLASLAAMLFAALFGDFWVFCVTSLLGAAFDLAFVIVQRYNRPRLLRAYGRRK